ncbi:MAG: hypothetical protein HZA53_10905 [Planctomycetes bacterium]|nr:hypothetical protein [Planctomycetota bacterium]
MRDLDPKLVDEVLDLDRLDLPERPRVRRIAWEPIVDQIGEPALEVWVILDDRTPPTHRTWKRMAPVHRSIRDALTTAGVQVFAYVHTRTASAFRRQRRVG